MKKITAITIVLTIIMALCLTLIGCEKEVEQTDIVTHTLPPTEATATEVEWAEVLCDIALFKDTEAVLYGEDFDTFALFGTNDNESYITLKVTDEAISKVKAFDNLSELQLVINGDTCADLNIDPTTFTGEITFGEAASYETLCRLASSIRGLY